MSKLEKPENASAPPHRIRSLITQELPLLRDHLLRLDPQSRRDRFNGYADEDFIRKYAEKCAADGTIIMAYFTDDGQVHAAAELHQPDLSSDSLPEIAFSVEAELRRKGVGSELFQRLIAVARSLGYERLRITTGAENHAMRALAAKFGAQLRFRYGESTGTIDLANEIADGAQNPQPAAAAPTIAEPARALLDLNRAWWSMWMRATGLGRAA